MARCKRCARFSLFSFAPDGYCPECTAWLRKQQEIEQARQQELRARREREEAERRRAAEEEAARLQELRARREREEAERRRAAEEEARTQREREEVELKKKAAAVLESRRMSSLIPSSIRGCEIAYRYTDVGIFVPNEATFSVDTVVPGAVFTLSQEKDNAYDPNAVRVMLKNRRIGYLYRGKLQNMANDWIDKKLPIRAQLTKCFPNDKRAEVTLVFYDYSDFKKLLMRYPDSKDYRLIGNTNEAMQDNLYFVHYGEECYLEYDFDKDKYLVISSCEIGYLPASASRLIEKNGEDAYQIYTSDPFTTDSGKQAISVYLFPKE